MFLFYQFSIKIYVIICTQHTHIYISIQTTFTYICVLFGYVYRHIQCNPEFRSACFIVGIIKWRFLADSILLPQDAYLFSTEAYLHFSILIPKSDCSGFSLVLSGFFREEDSVLCRFILYTRYKVFDSMPYIGNCIWHPVLQCPAQMSKFPYPISP